MGWGGVAVVVVCGLSEWCALVECQFGFIGATKYCIGHMVCYRYTSSPIFPLNFVLCHALLFKFSSRKGSPCSEYRIYLGNLFAFRIRCQSGWIRFCQLESSSNFWDFGEANPSNGCTTPVMILAYTNTSIGKSLGSRIAF
jgi:hypothetical protein